MPEVLVVTSDRQRVSALQTSEGEGGRIAAVWTGEWPEGKTPAQNPEGAGAWLRGEWSSAGFTARSVWVIVPREEVVLRHLELPNAPDEELPDMVRFQAASRSSVPLDQVCLDFIPLARFEGREGRDVLAATFPKTTIESFQKIVTAADRELVGVSFSSHALGEWGEQTDRRHAASLPGHEADATLVLAWGNSRVDLSVVCGRELTFAHSARIPVTEGGDPTSTVLAEVSRTLVAGQRLRPGLRVDHGWLVGGDALLAQALETRLECAFQLIDPIADHPQAAQLKKLQGQPIAAALLLGVRHPSITPGLNFLKPRQPPAKRDPRKRQIAVAAAAGLLLAFLGAGGGVLRLQSLDRQIAKLYSEKVERETVVKGGQPVLNASATIGDWNLRNINQLQELVSLEGMMPGDTERPYLSEYVFAVGSGDVLAKIGGEGSARTRDHVEALFDDLAVKQGYRVAAKQMTISRDPEYQHRYTLDLTVPKKKAEPAKAAAETGKKS